MVLRHEEIGPKEEKKKVCGEGAGDPNNTRTAGRRPRETWTSAGKRTTGI